MEWARRARPEPRLRGVLGQVLGAGLNPCLDVCGSPSNCLLTYPHWLRERTIRKTFVYARSGQANHSTYVRELQQGAFVPSHH